MKTGNKMGTGYVRNDTTNNIANGGVINATDLDGEFDAILAAFVASTGHTHNGTPSEGGAITVFGPVQDFVGGPSDFSPKTDSTYDLGKTAVRWRTAYVDDLNITTNIVVGGTVDGRDVAADGSKLDLVEASADVTDTANVAAAGALMDSEVDVDIKTLTLPPNTTISSFGKTLVGDADAEEMRTTLNLQSLRSEGLSSLNLGLYGSGDRPSFIDFHSYGEALSGAFGARLGRAPGTNGDLFLSNVGAGHVRVNTSGSFLVNGDFSGAPYASRAAALTAIPELPSTVQHISWVTPQGELIGVRRVASSTLIPDMSGWEPDTQQNAFFEHWGLEPRRIEKHEFRFSPPATVGTIMASQPDTAAQLNHIFTRFTGSINLTGFLRIDSSITIGSSVQIVPLAGQRRNCGFAILSNFDMSTDHCIYTQPAEPGATLGGFTIYMDQPSSPDSRDDLIRYPWALQYGDNARGTLRQLRIVGAINGIDARDSSRISNPGGTVFEDNELCCFGESLFIDGAFDFVTVRGNRSWSFEITGFPNLRSIFEDGRTVGFRGEKVDGLNASGIMNHKTRMVLGREQQLELRCTGDVGWLSRGETLTQATSGATGVLVDVIAGPRTVLRLRGTTGTFNTTDTITGSVSGALGANSVLTAVTARNNIPSTDITYQVALASMDAPGSYLELRGGKSTILGFYSSKIEGESQPTILVAGGDHTMYGADIRSSTPDAILFLNGVLRLNGGRLQSELVTGSFATVGAGQLTINAATFLWPTTGTRSDPFIRQLTGGQLSVTNCDTGQMTTAGVAISYQSDHIFNNCVNNRMVPHSIGFNPAWTLGRYESEGARSVNRRSFVGASITSLNVDSINGSSFVALGSAPVYGVRAWGNFNGVDGTARAFGNLAISRSAIGNFTFTMATAMPDANYSVNVSSSASTGLPVFGTTIISTTQFVIAVRNSDTGAAVNPENIFVQVVR